MDLTREQALKLHGEMWGDMQKERGNNPDCFSRYNYKAKWINKHGYDSDILNHCFLCEYASEKAESGCMCKYCPIDWSALTPDKTSRRYGFCTYKNPDLLEVWQTAPISEILALPERKVSE